MISYLTKLHPHLTNHKNLKNLLSTTFDDVALDAQLVVELDPTLKEWQIEAMTNDKAVK